MSWENLFKPYANNKCADQPAHPRSLISTFVFHCCDSSLCILATGISKVSRLQLDSAAEQAGLSLTWSQIPDDRFSHDVAQILSQVGGLEANLGRKPPGQPEAEIGFLM